MDRDTGYSRIIALAKFFDVPTDYLLGFTESRITKNIKLKELGYKPGYPSNSENFQVRFCGKSEYKFLDKPKPYEVSISFEVFP